MAWPHLSSQAEEEPARRGAPPHRLQGPAGSGLHVVLSLLLVEFALLLRSGVLVLLVLAHKVIHVALRLCELHLVHALTGIPVEERLPAKHPRKVLGHPLEHL